jgi:hypothetical protein
MGGKMSSHSVDATTICKLANSLEPEEWMKFTYQNAQDISQKSLMAFTTPVLIVLMEN